MPIDDTASPIGAQARAAFATLPQGAPPELFAAIEAATRDILVRHGLPEREKIAGGALCRVLAQVQRIAA